MRNGIASAFARRAPASAAIAAGAALVLVLYGLSDADLAAMARYLAQPR